MNAADAFSRLFVSPAMGAVFGERDEDGELALATLCDPAGDPVTAGDPATEVQLTYVLQSMQQEAPAPLEGVSLSGAVNSWSEQRHRVDLHRTELDDRGVRVAIGNHLLVGGVLWPVEKIINYGQTLVELEVTMPVEHRGPEARRSG